MEYINVVNVEKIIIQQQIIHFIYVYFVEHLTKQKKVLQIAFTNYKKII
jgi:hypothetical protein